LSGGLSLVPGDGEVVMKAGDGCGVEHR
jgi:hypothetical protein